MSGSIDWDGLKQKRPTRVATLSPATLSCELVLPFSLQAALEVVFIPVPTWRTPLRTLHVRRAGGDLQCRK